MEETISTLTQYQTSIYLGFLALATGLSYHFGKKEGHLDGQEQTIIDLMNDGIVDKEGIFIPRDKRNDE